ncbi:protein kinase [Patescibacteria group bacterium]|nr:protein kinase [Patescibacteria group bacterium]
MTSQYGNGVNFFTTGGKIPESFNPGIFVTGGADLRQSREIPQGTHIGSNGQYCVVGLLGHGQRPVYKVVEDDPSRGYFAAKHFRLDEEEAAREEHEIMLKLFGIDQVVSCETLLCDSSRGYFLIMEFLPGRNLCDVLGEAGQEKVSLAWEKLFTDVLSGLAWAHEHGVVHRDLKPSNIMMVPDESEAGYRFVLIDFGAAKKETAFVTQSNERAMTTMYYMAPEFLNGASITTQTDLYVVALVFLELILGIRKLGHDMFDNFQTGAQRLEDEYDLGMLETVLKNNLTSNPMERSATAMEFIEELEKASQAYQARVVYLERVGEITKKLLAHEQEVVAPFVYRKHVLFVEECKKLLLSPYAEALEEADKRCLDEGAKGRFLLRASFDYLRKCAGSSERDDKSAAEHMARSLVRDWWGDISRSEPEMKRLVGQAGLWELLKEVSLEADDNLHEKRRFEAKKATTPGKNGDQISKRMWSLLPPKDQQKIARIAYGHPYDGNGVMIQPPTLEPKPANGLVLNEEMIAEARRERWLSVHSTVNKQEKWYLRLEYTDVVSVIILLIAIVAMVYERSFSHASIAITCFGFLIAVVVDLVQGTFHRDKTFRSLEEFFRLKSGTYLCAAVPLALLMVSISLLIRLAP